jgi:chromosome segregation ATPase
MGDEYIDEEENFDLSNLPPYYAQKLNGFLREAIAKGYLTCVDVLVSKGADVNYIDRRDKTTALQAAILHGHKDITEYLYNKSNEKTRQAAHAFARENLKKLEAALSIFKDIPTPTTPQADKVVKEHEKPTVDHAAEKGKKKEADHLANNIQAEKYKELEADHSELKKEYAHLHKEYNGLELDYNDLQKKFDSHREETDKMIEQLKSQVDRLHNELIVEKEHNIETEDVLDQVGQELTQKMKEINLVKIERDSERRAKEVAKKMLTTDSPAAVATIADIPEPAKAGNTRNRIDLSFNTASLVPNKVKQEGSKDDLELHIEDRVKYRVRRLVKRWEERTFT